MPARLQGLLPRLLLSLLLFGAFSCIKSNAPSSSTSKTDKLKLLPGFKAEHLYSPSERGQGSWVAMTFDDKGRMITSDQYGALYRVTLPSETIDTVSVEKLAIGSDADRAADTTTLKIGMGYSQGLLYAFNSLYAMVNHNSNKDFDKSTGLYRLQDTDGDDQFDKVTLLKSFTGSPGEHGPHSMVLSPDGKSIFLTAGNHVDVPEMNSYRVLPVWQEDNLLPQIKDPRGHANNRMAPGGWIARIDPEGKHWELVGAGFRNEFDLAFNHAGDLFSYDADMEWDIGTPWYRPTRICHVTSGSEFGWRTGNGKWSAAYPDNLPPVVNIGQGSPTNFMNVLGSNFPPSYKKSMLAFDWSFGIVYAIHMQPDGASYTGKAEEFLSGSPLPLTDGIIGPDGALYFLTGGRRLESDLYKVYYEGEEATVPEQVADAAPNEKNALRRQLEGYHTPTEGAVDFAWPYLSDDDRFIRFAARMAVEHQPISEWRSKALQETNAAALTQAAIALAHQGGTEVRDQILTALTRIDYDQLTPSQQVDVVRAVELIIYRMGKPQGATLQKVVTYLNPHYPAASNELNRLMSKVLVHLSAPGAVEKTLTLLSNAVDDPIDEMAIESSDLILRNPAYGLDIANMLSKVPPRQQTYLATVLSQATSGWTPALREKYFKWFAEAFGYQGGRSYVGFVDKARKSALALVDQADFDFYNKLSGDSLLTKSGNDLANLPSAEGPGRRWSMEEAAPMLQEELINCDFENGKKMFAAALCSACHTVRGEGGLIGPDLTQLGTRFSPADILDHTINPDKEISDQYAATVLTLKDGSSVLGRLTSEDDANYYLSQNPFTPEVLKTVPKNDVVSTKHSTVSVMIPGLVNRLNENELKNLLAFLVAGGNPDNAVFAPQSRAANATSDAK
jgi:putative heme-binding domain-containing protein